MNAKKRLTLIAGLQYLAVGIFAGFSQGYVTSKIYVSGDAVQSAQNVVANLTLMKLGIVADLIQATVFVFLVMTLFRLLGAANRSVGHLMVVLVAISSAIMCLNNVFQYGALLVADTGAYSDALGVGGSQGLVLLLLELHHYGFLIAQIFFGLWLAPLGYLAKKAGIFPKALSWVLIVAALCYLLDTFLLFVSPELGEQVNSFLLVAPIVGELWMVGHLLYLGIRRGGNPLS